MESYGVSNKTWVSPRRTLRSHINHVTDYATIVKFVRPLSKTIKRDLDQTVSLARQVQVRY